MNQNHVICISAVYAMHSRALCYCFRDIPTDAHCVVFVFVVHPSADYLNYS